MADPVSWLLIERGWQVVDRAGEPVGRVDEVVGDPDKDVFDGLRVDAGAEPAYVTATHVLRIEEGRIELDVEADRLRDATGEPPGGTELRRDRSDEL